MFDEIAEYLDYVEVVVGELSSAGAFGFALACVERQWPVYKRASVGKPWTPTGIRTALDQAWQHVVDDVMLPADFVEQCQSGCPADDFPNDASASAAHLISHSAIDLLAAIQDREANYAHFAAVRNIDLIEMLCDEFDDGEVNKDLKLLVDNELEKQKQDLQAMRMSASPDRIQGLRESSMKKCLFDKHWFPR